MSRSRLVVASIIALLLFVVWGLLMGGSVRAQEVMGGSMSPTLETGDRLIIRNYGDLNIHHGSIVVMDSPDGWGSELIKRVVGLPGDLIEIRRGIVYVNGQKPEWHKGFDYPPFVFYPPSIVPPDHFFVLGDNRPLSYDSQEFGPVHESLIHGTAMFRYFPISRAGKIG